MTRRFAPLLFVILLLGGCAEIVTDILEYGSVLVEARRRSGEPVPGVSLTLYTGARVMAYGTTGADGNLKFENLPPDGFGVYAEPPEGYARPETLLGGPSTISVSGLALEEGGQRTVTFTYLKIGPGAISVRLTGPDGTPVPGIAMTLYRPTGPEREAVSDAQGSALFDAVPFGSWGIALYPPRGFLDWDEPTPFRDGIAIEEGSSESVAFALERCQGTVEARVSDRAGAPVEGHPVQLYDADGVLDDGVTGADGIHSFGPLSCWDVGLRLGRLVPWTHEEGRGRSFHDGIRVTRGSLQTFDFEVVRCTGTIRVRVQDAGGQPVPGAGLSFFTSERAVAQGVTDGTGAFAISDAGCGVEYGVSIQPPPGFSVQEGRGFSFFDGIVVREGGEALVTFRLTSG
jgi:hypothetical protein